MNIGILTQPLELNYGGILQAFALQKTLEHMGFSALIIDHHKKNIYSSFFKHLLNFISRIYLRIVKKKEVSIFWNSSINDHDFAVISSNLLAFKKKNILCTRTVDTSDLKQIDEEYQFDAYVVGSDQVWFWSWCPGSFLDFVKRDVIRLFYAASTGNKSFYDDEKIKQQCMDLAPLFSGISVRERYLVNKVSAILNRSVDFVLDPTLLLNEDDYIKSINFIPNKDDYVLYYILDMSPEKKKIIDNCAEHFSLPTKNAGPNEKYVRKRNVDLNSCTYPSMDFWISNFKQASFIVTDSFHGVCFSIIFKKNFLVIGNKSRGIERFNSLLSLFHLEKRMYHADSLSSILKENINYAEVQSIQDDMKKSSIEFLQKKLKN